LWRATDPFLLPLDSAFQESLALSHLAYGLDVTRGISGFGFFKGEFLYHAAHPPLLQLIYALLYSVFGVHEWVSRLVSALFATGTALLLWGALVRAGTRRAAFPAGIFFAVMTMAVAAGRTTNYEPGALFFISLFIYGYTRRGTRNGIALMTFAAVAGGLFEWTVYLVLPAVLGAAVFEERKLRSLKFILLPGIAATATLAAVFLWQKSVVGGIPVLGHAAIRSNPAAFMKPGGWPDFLSNIFVGVGLGWVLIFVGIHRMPAAYRAAPRSIAVFLAYALVPLLFLMLAPQLVKTHPLAALYFAPPAAVLMSLPVLDENRKNAVWALILLIVAYYAWSGARFMQKESPFFYNLSRLVAGKIDADCKAYNSAAVGYLRYYHGMETFHPVGANEPPPEEFAASDEICAFILDTSHPEVGYVREAMERRSARGDLFPAYRLHDTEVWLRGGPPGQIRLANMLEDAQLPPESSRRWENPSAEIITFGNEPKFGILHHSREKEESVIRFAGISIDGKRAFRSTARLAPSACDPSLSDGVAFSVTLASGKWSETFEGETAPREEGCIPVPVEMKVPAFHDKVTVILKVAPRKNASYDRFFWEDPRFESPGGK